MTAGFVERDDRARPRPTIGTRQDILAAGGRSMGPSTDRRADHPPRHGDGENNYEGSTTMAKIAAWRPAGKRFTLRESSAAGAVALAARGRLRSA